METPENIGTEGVPLVGVLIHQLFGSFRIIAAALHDLYEACLVGIPLNINGDVSAVLERGFALEELRGLGPPLVLLGPIAVAPASSSDSKRTTAIARPSSVTPLVLPSQPVAPGARSCTHWLTAASSACGFDVLPWMT